MKWKSILLIGLSIFVQIMGGPREKNSREPRTCIRKDDPCCVRTEGASQVNAVARFANTIGTVIKASPVKIDDAGNIEINGIVKDGTQVNWPTDYGPEGTFLASDGEGNLVYKTPEGGGNVYTSTAFSTNNALVLTDIPNKARKSPNESTTVKQSGIIIDAADNITGVNSLTANKVEVLAPITNPKDAATKEYVDNFISGELVVKSPALVVSKTNIGVSGIQTIDGVALAPNDRILLVGQTDDRENGLWLVAYGAWSRPSDFDTGNLAEQSYVLISSGDTQAGSSWLCETPAAVIGVDSLSFVEFAFPSKITAANVGSGNGRLFRDKSGVTLNFKSIKAGTHTVVIDNPNDVTIETDATSAKVPETIVARDALGTIAADVTGAASENVLKAGDTMTGNLNVANQAEIRLEDSAGGDYVGIRAPATIGTSYSIDLPDKAPLVGQYLQALSPSSMQWGTIGGLPLVTKKYYVSLDGDDSNDGSFSAPFRTIKHAVGQVNGVASLMNPVAISIGPGIFFEDNSGGAITLTADGISIIGNSEASTVIIPTDNTTDLFHISVSNVQLSQFTLQANPGSPSNATAIVFEAEMLGSTQVSGINIYSFKTGLSASSLSGQPVIVCKNNILANNGTCISYNNVRSLIQSCLFRGQLSNIAGNRGIETIGVKAEVAILDCFFTAYETAIYITGGASQRILGSNIETSVQGIVCEGGSISRLVGLNFILSVTPIGVNVAVSGAGTEASIAGSHFDGADVAGVPQGTAVRSINGAVLNLASSTIDNADIGIACGTIGDALTTFVRANSVSIINCVTDIKQVGGSTLHFVGGGFDVHKLDIDNSANVDIAAFDSNGNANFAVGDTTDTPQIIYQVENGQPISPYLKYESDYYGNKGTAYKNDNADPTFNATQAKSNDASYYVITGDRTKEAKLRLISDSGDIGKGDNIRGWEIAKGGIQADLAFTYTNNDTSGLAARGLNTVLQLNGFDNQIEFPVAINGPLPTNETAKLVWGSDTNLYRDTTNTLKTDGNLVVDSLTPNKIVATDANNKLISSNVSQTELGYLSGVTSPIQAQIDGKVAKAGDTMTGVLTMPAGTAANPSIQFTGSSSTGISAAVANTLSLDTAGVERVKISPAGTVAINQFSSAGVVHNDASGQLSSSLIVNDDISSSAAIVDTKLATISSIGKVANSATTATTANTPNAIVARDGSGNFSAGTITANLVGDVTGDLTGNADTATTAATATSFSGSLSGDVIGPQNSTQVSTVGGQTAANVASGVIAANAATDTNTNNTIVKRDGAGNFIAGTITADLVGDVTGDLIGNADTATNATTAINFSAALSGDVIGNQGSTVVNTVGGQTAANVASGAAAANAATDSNSPTMIVKRDGSGNFSAGTITANIVGNVTGNLAGNAATATLATDATTAVNFSGALSGDVIGNQSSTQVNTVGGQTAANIASGVVAANAATDTDTGDTIVKRDGSGNFAANMITINGTISNSTDVVTKSYVDNAVTAGLVAKEAAVVVSKTDISLTGTQTIDGIDLVVDDRVLLVGQTDDVENGLWLVKNGSWIRPADFDTGDQAEGAYVLISSGDTQAGSSWLCNTPTAIIDTDPIMFVQFSLPGQTTGNNVGSGAGKIFKDKTGVALNFKSIAADTHMVVTNNSDDVTVGTDATSANTPDTIVARDGTGSFAGSLTGAASENVLKAGDTMTGNLNLAAQSELRLQDATGGEYVGLRAPVTVGTSYTLDLPTGGPQAGQILRAISGSETEWVTLNDPPIARMFYVTLDGDDSNDGSLAAPFRTVKHAVEQANLISSVSNPVGINIGTGVFIENNTGGPIAISAGGISILGRSVSSTKIIPMSNAQDLFYVTTPRIEFSDITLVTSPGSTATAINLVVSGSDRIRFNSITAALFNKGFDLSSTGGTPPAVFFDNLQVAGNGISLSLNNIQAVIRNSVFRGPVYGPAANTAIEMTGGICAADVLNSVFVLFDKGISVDGGALVRVLGSDIETTRNGIECLAGSKAQIIGTSFAFNESGAVNVLASGVDASVYVQGCLFDCEDATDTPQGTAIKAVLGGRVLLNGGAIDEAVVALECGQAGDTDTTQIQATGVSIKECVTDVKQLGSSKLYFVGGVFDAHKLNISNPTNVEIVGFHANQEANFAIGDTTDRPQTIYQIENGQTTSPRLKYESDYYGNKGTVYKNDNADPTFNATQANSNDASYYVITGDRTKEAKLKLVSDAGNIGNGDNMRGWEIAKGGAQADLAFTYTNNDTSGLAARGPNSVMQLNGFDNQIEFPVAINGPLPTNDTAKLIWGSDTTLYRDASSTLKTDGDLVVDGLTPNKIVTTDANNKLISSNVSQTELGYLSGVTSPIQTQIDSKVAKAGDTMTGVLTMPAGTAANPSIQFTGSSSTGISAAIANTLSFDTAGVERVKISPTGTVAISQLSSPGVVHNDASGQLSSSLIVNDDISSTAAIVDTKLATISSIGKVANSATTATDANTPNTIVGRDGSGNFTAGTITADLVGDVIGDLTGNADTATNATTAVNFTGSLTGDVIGTQNSTQVSAVGGQTAANVASGVTAANAATNTNTPNTIVKRDGSGNFTAGTVTADLVGDVTGGLTGNADTATNATTAVNFTAPLSGDVIGNQNSTQVSTVGGETAANIALGANAANAATSTNSPSTIVKRDGSGNFNTNMISLLGAVTNATDATTKGYVDSSVDSVLVVKEPAVVVSVTDVILSGTQTIDGVDLVVDDRVLLIEQTNDVENGLWVVKNGAWVRPTDFDTGDQAEGAYILTTSGEDRAGSSWFCDTPTAVIDTDPISFVQFSLPGQTTAQNVGLGAGKIFKDKTGVALNFKSIAADTHIVVTNNSDDVTVGTDATSANTPDTIVARDGIGSFAGSLTGAASENVLKAGDTMTGDLNLAAQSELKLQDATGGEYVGLRAPATVGTSYTVDLPADGPQAGQLLRATSGTATEWVTLNDPPIARMFYVTLDGADTNDGSLAAPFRTVKHAVEQANLISSVSNPVGINIGTGVFIENNTGGPIAISAGGISILGRSVSSTKIIPMSNAQDLFYVTTPRIEFSDITLVTSPGSTATAINLVVSGSDRIRFNSITAALFNKGFDLSSTGGIPPAVFFDNLQVAGNSISLSLNNIQAVIRNSVFRGPVFGPAANTAIEMTGGICAADVLNSVFVLFDKGISVDGGALVRVLGSDIESTKNGIECLAGSKAQIIGTSFAFNESGAINVLASGADASVYVEGCLFDCGDATDTPQGTAIKAISGGTITMNGGAIDQAVVAIECGQAGDINTTKMEATGVSIKECTTDIKQLGISRLHFVGGVFDAHKLNISDPTNVEIVGFHANQEANFAIGDTTDRPQTIYQIENGQATSPRLKYESDYYGNKGTVYKNDNADKTFNATQANSNDASYYVITGDRTKEAKLKLVSDAGNIGNGDNMRGWEIVKGGAQADLAFTYTNNDTSGLAARGPNSVMQLNGFDNQIEFPVAVNGPLPTNDTAKLIWGSDTNLYRDTTNTLKTDGDLVVDGLTPNKIVATDATNKLVSSNVSQTELGYLSGVTSPIQAQIDGKVAKAGDTMTGVLTMPAGTAANPSIQFSGSSSTGISAAVANTLSLDTAGVERVKISPAGTVAISQFSSPGVVHNDASGQLSSSLIVNDDISSSAAIVDTKLATISSIGKVANSATTATNTNTPNTIVARDGSGNFSAGTVTADLVGDVTGNLTGNADTATNATTAVNFSGSLSGDVTGNQNSTVVNTVGGQTAANVVSGANAANAATDTNTGDTIVKRDGSGNFSAGTVTADLVGDVTGNLTGNADTATNATTAVNFSGSLSGDVIGNQNSTQVSTVGGQTAANVASGANAANAATSTNSPSTIVKRDGSGNFSAGTITANIVGNVTGDLTGNADTATSAASATTAVSFSGALSGDVIGNQSSTQVNTVGGQTAANIAAGVIAANAATSNNTVDTIVKRDGSGNFAANMITILGTISNSTDAVTKDYVDNAVSAGLVAKEPAVVVSKTDISLTGTQTIDGIDLVVDDRVLLVGQTDDVENGLWLVKNSSWIRPSDFDTGDQAEGTYVLISSGDTQAGSSWLCNTPTAIIDTDPIMFVQFSLPGQTTGNNVGTGAGKLFKDKTGVALNFKSIAADTHMVVTNNSDDVTLSTDATSANTPDTIVARDGTGSFAGGLTGAASENVLKTGDTMTGNLNIADQKEIRFEDAAGGEYVGLRAPTTIGGSYTVDLPENAPQAGQFLRAKSSNAVEWTTVDAPPSATKTYYVTLAGSDVGNNGSLSEPFRTVKHAVEQADLVASSTNPVVISVGPGTFEEDNSGGAITINSDGISIVGSSIASTKIMPTTTTEDLFYITASRVELSDLTIQSDIGSTANAINLVVNYTNRIRFNSIAVLLFETGFNLNSTGGLAPIAFFNNVQCTANNTCISINNMQAIISCSIFRGPLFGGAANTAIEVVGNNSLVNIFNNLFLLFDTGILVDGGARVKLLSSDFETTKKGIVCQGGSKAELLGSSFSLNESGAINITSQGTGSSVYIEGCLFECEDASGTPQGTALYTVDAAKMFINSSTISEAVTGIACGQTGDTDTTKIKATGVSLKECLTDVKQLGASQLHFVGGVFDSHKLNIADPTNVEIVGFHANSDANFAIGDTTDTPQTIYQIENGQTSSPCLKYESDYYGNKGTVYKNDNADPTFNATQANSNDASYYVITGDRTKEAKLKLVSDAGNIGNGDNMRGWEIVKGGVQADLAFTYTNNDTSGLAARGPNSVMQLNGFDNQIEFPVAVNGPLPTNDTAKLIWGSDTTLYRDTSSTLKTDGDLVVDGLTPNKIVTTDANNKLISSNVSQTELGYLSGVTSPIQTQIDSKVAKAGDTMTGVLTMPAGSAANPSIQFTGSSSTGISAATANTLSLDTAGVERVKISPTGTVAINQFSSPGVVHNDASGQLSSSLIVNDDISSSAAIVDTKLATISSIGKVANSATTATDANTPNSIVARDGSGNFNAGTITADFVGDVTGDLTGNADTATNATTAVNFTGALSGDVIGNQNSTQVSTVGGQTAANVASGAVAANAATNTNTPNSIVKRDGSGNFIAGTITADFVGDVTGDLTGNADTATNATTAVNFTGALSGDVIGNQNSTQVSTVGGQTAANVASGVTAANAATDSNSPSTIVKRDGSGNFSAGTIIAALTGAASANVLKAGDTMTGALTMPAGSVISPSIKFSGSTNTGISAAVANKLSFDTNGAERMTISDTEVMALIALIAKNVLCVQGFQEVTIFSGSVVAASSTTATLLLKHSLSYNFSITVRFPPSPIDGQLFTIVLGNENDWNVTISNLPASGSSSDIINPVTRLNAMNRPQASLNGASVTYIYHASDDAWYRYRRG